MPAIFTQHNIRLDDGRLTLPEKEEQVGESLRFLALKRLLETIFVGPKNHLRLADLGCLEGGYSVAFARMGFSVLGVEVREANIAACNYVKDNTYLPNLTFVQDDAWNIAKYGSFDVMFCSGLLYHLDQPKSFLKLLSSITSKILIMPTHFSTEEPSKHFHLSELQENEGLPGRWYTEFADDTQFENRENARWSSWDNHKSFWIKREALIQAIKDVGFDIVMEQYDTLAPDINESMTSGYYKTMSHGTFIGIKAK